MARKSCKVAWLPRSVFQGIIRQALNLEIPKCGIHVGFCLQSCNKKLFIDKLQCIWQNMTDIVRNSLYFYTYIIWYLFLFDQYFGYYYDSFVMQQLIILICHLYILVDVMRHPVNFLTQIKLFIHTLLPMTLLRESSYANNPRVKKNFNIVWPKLHFILERENITSIL